MNSSPHIQPPKFLLRFFRWFCDPAIAEDIEGDLREIFERDVATTGNITKAKLQFSVRVLGLFRPGIVKKIGRSSLLNHPSPMFKNYFITSVRSLVRSIRGGLGPKGLVRSSAHPTQLAAPGFARPRYCQSRRSATWSTSGQSSR